MKVRIVKEFHDKSDFRKVYKVNDLVDFSDSRFEELNALGLVEAVNVTPKVKEDASDNEQSVVPEQKPERKRRTRKDD